MQCPYTTVENLAWCNPEHTMFVCDVFFLHINEKVPFGCSQAEVGVYDHVTTIWNRAMAGEFGSIAEYVEPDNSLAADSAFGTDAEIPGAIL